MHNEAFDQISRVITCGGWEFLLNLLNRILANTKQGRLDKDRCLRLRPAELEGSDRS